MTDLNKLCDNAASYEEGIWAADAGDPAPRISDSSAFAHGYRTRINELKSTDRDCLKVELTGFDSTNDIY